MEQNLNMLKQFESILKQCLIKRFGAFLPQNKITYLNQTQFFEINDLNSGLNAKTIQGNITRRMLDSIIDVTCLKELSLDGINTSTIVYGRFLEDGLIEYYAKQIASQFHFDINEIPELKENLELVTKLKECYKDGLDEKVFTSDAIKLLDKEELKDVILTCDTKAIEEYLKKNKKVANAMNDKTEDSNLFKGITSKEDTVQIVFLNEKKYIKYIDQDDKVHLVEIKNYSKANDFYKEKISSIKPGEKLDTKAFFDELCEIATEEKLSTVKDMQNDIIPEEAQGMIKFVEQTPKIQEQTLESYNRTQDLTHSEDGTIHVIEETNDIVTTEQAGNRIEANIVKGGNESPEISDQQEKQNIYTPTLTPEEYTDLCMRYANNEPLSQAELNALWSATPGMEGEVIEEKGPTLKMSSGGAGFANQYTLIYILASILFVGIFIGALIFRVIN